MGRLVALLLPLVITAACFVPVEELAQSDGGLEPFDGGTQPEQPSGIAVEGCHYIGALDRAGFRGNASDAGPCVTLMLMNTYEAFDGGALELPPGWRVQSASSRDGRCGVTWQGGNWISTDQLRGFVRFPADAGFPSTASVDVRLRFDGGAGAVRILGDGVSLQASCLP